jgi:hypothetical protein
MLSSLDKFGAGLYKPEKIVGFWRASGKLPAYSPRRRDAMRALPYQNELFTWAELSTVGFQLKQRSLFKGYRFLLILSRTLNFRKLPVGG